MGKASSLFNGNSDQTLIKRITPTQEQREFLQTQWNALADHLKAELYADYGFPISTWLQGSYKFATLIRPVHIVEEYDVDVGIYFEWDDESDSQPTPTQLRNWVQQELINYAAMVEDLKHIEAPPKERCSRAVYTNTVSYTHLDVYKRQCEHQVVSLH